MKLSMADGANTTRENWRTLQRLAGLYFLALREEHPDWDLEALQRHMNLPRTNMLIKLAGEAGFGRLTKLSICQENKVLRAVLQGICAPEKIAVQAETSPEAVREYLDKNNIPYGAGGYGQVPWGETSAVQGNLSHSKLRRISKKGQLSYKGFVYGLGSEYAGQQCWVEEAGERVLIHCSNKKTLAFRNKE